VFIIEIADDRFLDPHYIIICFFRNNNIFIDFYKLLLEKYFTRNRMNKLKYQLIDSIFIANTNGIEKIGRNKLYKNKKGAKISCVTVSFGIPISILIKGGNVHDSQFVEDHMKSMLIICNKGNNRKNYKHKLFMLGDKGYDSKEIRKILSENNYYSIIDYNKRNIKDKANIRKFKTTEKTIYRIKVENLFCHMKKNSSSIKNIFTFATNVFSVH